MKECFKCLETKELKDFYKHKEMFDGHLNKCKECTKRDVRKHREENLESIREYDRNRPNHLERNKSNIERGKEKYHNDLEYKRSVLETKKSWANNNAVKVMAQNALGNAVRDGKVEKPSDCQHCLENNGIIHGHHWSYEEVHWLDVMWLCPSCHGAEHKRLNEIARNQKSSMTTT